MALYPQSAARQGVLPNSFSFRCFHLWIRNWVHQGSWGCVILDLLCIDKGNTWEKFTQWGVRNFRGTNRFKHTLLLPYNEQSHWFLFILEHHRTLHFDYIFEYHNTWKENQFVKCVALGWFYVKNILHNSNKWMIIGIGPIVHVPLPPHNGTWECGYLVVEYFS
jgi:hypothetical protein